MSTERRGKPRVESRSGAKVIILSAPEAPQLENRSFGCMTEDISLGGVRFRVDAPLPRGSMIELRFDARASGPALWHVGRVVWARAEPGNGACSVGVQFTRTPEDTLFAWETLIEEKLSRAGA